LGRFTASQGDQVGFLAPIQLALVVTLGLPGSYGRFHPFLDASLPHPVDGRQPDIQSLGYGLVIVTAIGLE
jgi:hypothetical protein